jgi:hypothetical protein
LSTLSIARARRIGIWGGERVKFFSKPRALIDNVDKYGRMSACCRVVCGARAPLIRADFLRPSNRCAWP